MQDLFPLARAYEATSAASTGLAADELLPRQALIVRPARVEPDGRGVAADPGPKDVRAGARVDDEVNDQPVSAFRMRECFGRATAVAARGSAWVMSSLPDALRFCRVKPTPYYRGIPHREFDKPFWGAPSRRPS